MEREHIEQEPATRRTRRPHSSGSGPVAEHPAVPIASAVGNAAFSRAVQRQSERSQGAGPLDPDIAEDIDAARSGGSPLPDDVQAEMQDHLGADLSEVRVHTDSTAASLNRSVQAEAFTSGSDLFFSPGKYDPDSSAGRSLLGHELTHVVQQSTGDGVKPGEVSHPNDAAEGEAKAVGDAVGSTTASPVTAAASTVAREAVPEEEEEVPGVAASVAREEVPEEEEEQAT